ncbi:hypothetical protein [Pedobacter nutrimenti]|uniref:Uncharacterized protein n=1 Tax=Pedobacter nutrimenti TaxID=1241337 RepID=A0A318U626_9SPHI|nr:hypothetical protein [Pedobacter nutrimenti]PYF68495.1 hypothetical protein B0O44_11282 [Pedobacter nutrimenti]
MENQTALIYGAGLFIIFGTCRVYLNKFKFKRSLAGLLGLCMMGQILLNNILDFTPNSNYPADLQNLGYQVAQITNPVAIVLLAFLTIISSIRIVSKLCVFSKKPEFGDFSSMSDESKIRNQSL